MDSSFTGIGIGFDHSLEGDTILRSNPKKHCQILHEGGAVSIVQNGIETKIIARGGAWR